MERSLEDLSLAHEALTAGDTARANEHLSWQSARPTTMLGHTVLLFAAQLFARRKEAR